ncbi:SDR family NAD(P)-dependent oxidoreductase [Rufibacter sp. H-1]|uniref:SDR family NAD(P)-dependent oxidoreductase n=1 Tax=Rufibacter sediminis TaxID=2762756 RepID=A0ABR6VRM5_9BACT|nr:SDR family NAD(P)-dependent oxidoreductase [Rufibacter sediminis]MBC3539855.1 SDR family NAD(P)-dependent oxidoreductase [Rufibacter sediminis]
MRLLPHYSLFESSHFLKNSPESPLWKETAKPVKTPLPVRAITPITSGKRLSKARSFPRYTGLLLVLLSFWLGGCATSELGSSGQKKVAGKTFVIVGASSGFGRGVAEQLGAYKANVVLAARRGELLEEIATKIRAAGGTALVVPMDISKPKDVQRLTQAALQQYGKIDVWINMAGVGAIGRFWEIPIEDQARIVDINLKGFIYGSHAAINQFKAQGYGTLINMGSVESVNPLAYHASYAATKGGILNLGQAINQELRLSGLKKNIRVVTVEPWAVDTPFWGHSANYSGKTARMAIMDPPSKVVNATIRASLRGRHEKPVGWKAKSTWVMHRYLPRFSEWLSGNVIHRSQMRNAAPGPNTSGAAHEPMQTGRGVEDGVRQRMHEENRQRKQSKNK